MAIKLYQWDTSVQETLVSPNKYDGTYQVKWWQSGYVTMSEGLAVLFNGLNNDILVKSDAAGVAAVKLFSKQHYDMEKVSNIRLKYDINDEFFALRTDNTTIKNDIATIIAAVETERDALLDVS